MKLKGKMIFRAASILASAAAMFFCASCANQLSGGYVSDSDSGAKTLNIAVTNYSELASGSSRSLASSRTIMPDSYDSDGVDLYIYGVAATGDAFTAPVKVEFEGNPDGAEGAASKTVGKIKIDAEAVIWEFTLAAVAKNDVPATLDEMKEKAVLIGYASLDMTYGDTAKFTLSPDGLTKEASVAMKLYNDGWATPDGFTIKAGIYKLTDGADGLLKATSDADSAAWSAWANGDGTKLTETAYTGSANLELFAKYSNGAQDVEFLQKEDYFIKGAWLTVDGTQFTDGQKTLTIDASAKTSSTWNFKPAADGKKITDEFKYDSVTLAFTKGGQTYWSGTEYDVGTAGHDFEIPLSKLNPGTYQITVSARYSTNIYVTYPVTVTITR